METKAVSPECQLQCLPQIAEPLGRLQTVWQLRNRLKHIARRRLRYIRNWVSEVVGGRHTAPALGVNAAAGRLEAGDRVRVKSRQEIQATLDRWDRLKGCDFMEEQSAYCGTSQRVLKRMDRFLDERTYRILKCRGIVLLEGVMCRGTDLGACDRCCLFFWREEWLEKIG